MIARALAGPLHACAEHGRGVLPGVMLAGLIAMSAHFVSDHHGGPAMLYALLIGVAFNFHGTDSRTAPGIDLAASGVLRLGVALLGARVTVGEIAALGWNTLALVIAAVAGALAGGFAIARLLSLPREQALLSAGAVAICGASATLAIAAALPPDRARANQVALTVAGVAALSSLAMILYPVLAQALGLDERSSGVFLGATIHDVAQAVGAGQLVSDGAGEVAAAVKLMRVALLAPVIVAIAWWFRAPGAAGTARAPLLPGFLAAYLVLVAANSLGALPALLVQTLRELSGWCIAIAVAALGTRISVRELAQGGLRPLLAMAAQTAWLALLVAAWLLLRS